MSPPTTTAHISPTHSRTTGDYQVSLSASDWEGSGYGGSLSVYAADVPPDLRLDGNDFALRNVNYTLNLFHYDPGNDPLTSWQINWGDTHSQTVSGDASSVTHRYTSYGSYTITGAAFEENGEFPFYPQSPLTLTVMQGAPDAPTGLKAIPLSRSSILLKWKMPADTDADGFNIYASG